MHAQKPVMQVQETSMLVRLKKIYASSKTFYVSAVENISASREFYLFIKIYLYRVYTY